MKPRITIVGSSNTDMIIRLPHLPQPGETVLGGEFFTAAGGKGANQAVAAARAGGRVNLIARLGCDTLGNQALAGFRHCGIRTAHVVRDPTVASGVALIFVGRHGTNSIAVAGGANTRLSPDDVHRAAKAFIHARVVLLQLEIPLPAVRAAVAQASDAGAQVILNPAPARHLPKSLLRKIHTITPNEIEAEYLTGTTIHNSNSIAQAADRLLLQGVHTAVITLGPRGAYVANATTRQFVRGFQVKAVDTVAAGDVFNGALAVALAEQQPLLNAVRFANAAAAISVTRPGAQPSAPERDEIEALLKQRPS